MTNPQLPAAATGRRPGSNVRPGSFPAVPTGPTACAAVHGFVVALAYVGHTIGVEAGAQFLAFVAAQCGPLTEGAVIAKFTANAFLKGVTP